jgi:exopolysaccharide biosynthesis polyprenyl glycosylphosphotransferase
MVIQQPDNLATFPDSSLYLESQQTAEACHVQPRITRRAKNKAATPSPLSLIVADGVVAAVTATFAYAVTTPLRSLWVDDIIRGPVTLVALLIPYVISVLVASHVSGLQDPRHCGVNSKLVRRCALAMILAMSFTYLYFALFSFQLLGRVLGLLLATSLVVGLFVIRYLFARLSHRYQTTHCIVGDDRFHFEAAQALHDRPAHIGVSKPLLFNINDDGSLIDFVHDNNIDEIVMDTKSQRITAAEMLALAVRGIKITPFPNYVSDQLGIVPIQSTSAEWLACSVEISRPFYFLVKRVFDIVGSMAALVVAMPMMLIAAALIRLEGRGPVIYSQTRTGQFGRPFTIYKLRTMSVNAERDGAQWAKTRDVRVTKVGRFLRRTRIDEMPQFFNIILGEMSIVGPRPERPEFVRELAAEIPFYDVRHLAKPGLTGWAQINLPYGASVEDSESKLEYDLYYVRRCSVLIDIHICLRTVVALFHGGR